MSKINFLERFASKEYAMGRLEHLSLKHGELARIKNTGSDLDGTMVYVAGVASRHIVDTYILKFAYGEVRVAPDGEEFSAFVMSEACLERV